MKNLTVLLFFLAGAAPGVAALDFEFGMYMRAPVGTNSQGGKQIQLINPGSRGNEFRLGNEAGYGEARFTGHVLKGGSPDDPFFFANMTMAYDAQMNSQYGDTYGTSGNVQLIQSYAKGGNFDGIHASFWAGKRHYRDADIYIHDFYYFADMGGIGGGVEDVRLPHGTLAVALLQSADSTFQNTTLGYPAKQVLDLRWFNVKLTAQDALHFWAATGYAAPGSGEKLNAGSGTYDPVEFEAATGAIAGLRWGHALENGQNDVALMYGTGVL
ncbi:MAG: carbohydrate porin, partial [Bdellovibrionales bacterium]